MMELVSLEEEGRGLLFFLPHEDTGRRWSSINQEAGSLQDLSLLAFPATRTLRNTCLLFKPLCPWVCGVLLKQSGQMKTPTERLHSEKE